MESDETSPSSRLTSQKNKTIFLAGSVIVAAMGAALLLAVSNSCSINHMMIVNEISANRQAPDPESCEALTHRIDAFNERCAPYVEIPDCG